MCGARCYRADSMTSLAAAWAEAHGVSATAEPGTFVRQGMVRRLIKKPTVIIAVVILITGAGNVINDYFDYRIDQVNRPDRPIPAGTVSLSGARRYALLLFVAGVLLSFGTTLLCALLAVLNALLLIMYAARLKAIPLVGNLTVSYLAASIFIESLA